MIEKRKYDTVFFTYPVVDLIAPFQSSFPINANNTYLIDTIQNEPGGPANILIMGKRIGLNILPVGIVGDDFYGRFLLSEYKKEGIDDSNIIVKPEFETRKAIVLVDENGNHAFVSMVEGIITSFKNAEELIRNSKSLCFSGYYVTTETMREEYMRLMRLAKSNSNLIFFDPGPLVKFIPKNCIEEILESSTVTLLNESEAYAISALTDVEKSASFISSMTSGLVVVKTGERGCYIYSKNHNLGNWYDGFKVKMVDTTAAGDAFWAAFMHGYISGWDLETVARFSNAVGAAKVQKFGSGTKVPTFDEIVCVLEEGGFNIPEINKKDRNFNKLILHRCKAI